MFRFFVSSRINWATEQSYFVPFRFFFDPYEYFFRFEPRWHPRTPPVINTSNVTAAQAAALQANGSVTSFTVRDTAAHIAAYFDALNGDTKLGGITVTTAGPLAITATQFANDTFVEAKLASGTQYALSGVSVADAASIQANAAVGSFTIADTAAAVAGATGLAADTKLAGVGVLDSSANILANLPALAGVAGLNSLALTDGSVLAVSGAQYASYTATLDLLVPGDRLSVTGASVSAASGIQADWHVGGFTVSDSAANVLAGLSQLATDSKLTSFAITDVSTLSVTASQYFAYQSMLDRIAGGETLSVSGVSAAGAKVAGADAHVGSFSVSDTLGNIGSYLSTLEGYAKAGTLTAIDVADTGQTLTLTAAQYAADQDAIALMHGNFTIVQGAPATHMTINLLWDASTANAPAAWKSDVQYAVDYFQSLITTPITLNLRVGYGESGGYTLGSGSLGEEVGNAGTYITASQFKSALQNSVASDPTLVSALANLPSGSNMVYITAAQEKALGILPGNGTSVDASIGFATDPDQTLFAYAPTARAVAGQYDFIGVVEHEISHALGRVSYIGTTTSLDLFRYSVPGVLAPAGASSYFSIDGGVTNLNNFSTSSDTADWAPSAGADANDAYSPVGTANLFTATDVAMLNVLGYSLSATPPSAAGAASGSGSAPAAGTLVASASAGLSAPSLNFIGTPATTSFSAAVTSLETALVPASGILEIGGFQYGVDHLKIDFSVLGGALGAYDTSLNGAHAIAIAGSHDMGQGLVLTGLPSNYTAADLMAHHMTISGSAATIA